METHQIEINCDMGESIEFYSSGHDLHLMQYVDSISIACGYHAGSEYLFKKTLENAIKLNLNIGAHPGFDDKKGFGRKELYLTYNQILELILDQLFFAKKICNEFGIDLHHVKPHGALYNMSAKNETYAQAIAESVHVFDPNLIIYALAQSPTLGVFSDKALMIFQEGFADRRYQNNGQLVHRSNDKAIIDDIISVKVQTERFCKGIPIQTIDGQQLKLQIDTICIHSDTKNALEFAKSIAETVRYYKLSDQSPAQS